MILKDRVGIVPYCLCVTCVSKFARDFVKALKHRH